jgi:hypothetical protein
MFHVHEDMGNGAESGREFPAAQLNAAGEAHLHCPGCNKQFPDGNEPTYDPCGVRYCLDCVGQRCSVKRLAEQLFRTRPEPKCERCGRVLPHSKPTYQPSLGVYVTAVGVCTGIPKAAQCDVQGHPYDLAAILDRDLMLPCSEPPCDEPHQVEARECDGS